MATRRPDCGAGWDVRVGKGTGRGQSDPGPGRAPQQSLGIGRHAAVDGGHDRWEWAVWIDATSEELQQVESVVYTLHPTFSDPVRVVKDRATKYRLKESGWGEFELRASVHRKGGRMVNLKHWLELRYPEGTSRRRASPKDGPVIFLSSSPADASVAEAIRIGLESQ